ncbi:hypothetical protein [Streptomyces sp. NPDC058457]|uniref:hypothetical protein n=1 Tax=Streptomyces sp. NPDC058457 TaxID=3346507 RepID=UPI0036529853
MADLAAVLPVLRTAGQGPAFAVPQKAPLAIAGSSDWRSADDEFDLLLLGAQINEEPRS